MNGHSGGVHIGYECKLCGIRIGTYVQVGGKEPTCPRCKRLMRPIEEADAPEMVANFICPVCHSAFGAIVSLTISPPVLYHILAPTLVQIKF